MLVDSQVAAAHELLIDPELRLKESVSRCSVFSEH